MQEYCGHSLNLAKPSINLVVWHGSAWLTQQHKEHMQTNAAVHNKKPDGSLRHKSTPTKEIHVQLCTYSTSPHTYKYFHVHRWHTGKVCTTYNFPVSPQEILLPPRFRALSHIQLLNFKHANKQQPSNPTLSLACPAPANTTRFNMSTTSSHQYVTMMTSS
jgi:hypothetical protein